MNNYNNKAAILNPLLKPFSVLIGEWKIEASHPMFPDITLHGQAFFKWAEGGAFLMLHSKIDHEKFPENISIFGSDNVLGTYFMLYFDERKVSRKCDVVFENNVLKWWRNAPGFSQRYAFTFSADGNTIVSKGELSKDHITWEKDLDTTYTRIT